VRSRSTFGGGFVGWDALGTAGLEPGGGPRKRRSMEREDMCFKRFVEADNLDYNHFISST
jgi:hypothetical protein